ncbi:MAG: NADH-ubiquinone oxidoreductase subunit E family protein [Epsilonproteobacteria bacterium]|nr:NADH-ubiquinone oxidoreductase subunit E family protein [Campylobacterota bacterium]
MERYDLRKYKDNFYDRMVEVIEKEAKPGEVIIFMFEVGDFTPVQKSADMMKDLGHEIMNSIKFNEVDWTLVVKRKTS